MPQNRDSLREFLARQNHVDFSFLKKSFLFDSEAGRISREEVCDAHPELIRLAKHYGEVLGEMCPICGQNELVGVLYAFGYRLPKSGVAIVSAEDLTELPIEEGEIKLYNVEVCTLCNWNYLIKCYQLSNKETRPKRNRAKGLS